MEMLYERCAGLDVHKKNVKVDLIPPGHHHQSTKEILTYLTTTHELLQMRDWLHAESLDPPDHGINRGEHWN